MSVSPRSLAGLALLLAGTACTPAPSPLLPTLKAEFRPGLALTDAVRLLDTHGTTHSEKSAAECQALLDRSPNSAQLPPRGGPCIFGKIPLSKSWYGLHTDLILQLVFTPDGRLADGQFEEISTFL